MSIENGVKLIPYNLSPCQVALIRWFVQHPYSQINLKVHDGIPLEAFVKTDDGLGYDVVRFDKIAREMGLA